MYYNTTYHILAAQVQLQLGSFAQCQCVYVSITLFHYLK